MYHYPAHDNMMQPICPCRVCMQNRNPASFFPSLYRSIPKGNISNQDANKVAEQLNVDLTKFDFNEFKLGLELEAKNAEHYLSSEIDFKILLLMGKMVLKNLNEISGYFAELGAMRIPFHMRLPGTI